MIRLLFLKCCLLFTVSVMANTILVKDMEELNAANKQAKPGDIIVLQNGTWKNVTVSLNCNGTPGNPVTFKAQTPGKVLITGNSKLNIGGNHIVVDGLYFVNGYSGDDAVITYRVDKNQLANHCRVTNCVINDFNNPGRLDENYWLAFYGKNNKLDHCSLLNKKNIGVLLAVILDDERSRENFHSIEHNYFGVRLPLASNGGEIIRVGVSQHCQFNSNTQITDNYFEHCDGEAEVISIKSCSNIVRNNLFKECQGSVVLRHGDNNTVENNIFLGNDKEGTGGIRVINKGQWVVNNFLYKCRGTGFRSPLTIMNGIPNSPANRYVQVTDAVIANNTFLNCSPVSFCEGSDTERTLPPDKVFLLNNSFYNNKDYDIYNAFDDIGGFNFAGNNISREIKQSTVDGFERTSFTTQKADVIPLPVSKTVFAINDSLQEVAQERLKHGLATRPGFSDLALLKRIMANTSSCGATWFVNSKKPPKKITVTCKTTEEVKLALANTKPGSLVINLTAKNYLLSASLQVNRDVEIISTQKQKISFTSPEGTRPDYAFFEIHGGADFKMTGLEIDLGGYDYRFQNFIRTATSGTSKHVNISIRSCTFKNMEAGSGTFFRASKSVVCDSIIIANCTFEKNFGNLLEFTEETDKKGYYNVEKLVFTGNNINNHTGAVLRMLRGGNDESTLGPKLIFRNNKLQNCKPGPYNSGAMISLTGTQVSFISDNQFNKCYAEQEAFIHYEDFVRATHLLNNNIIKNSGAVTTNKYVQALDNDIQ